MKLVADENVDKPIVDALRAAGHEVWYVAEQAPGITDEAVIAASVGRDALLLPRPALPNIESGRSLRWPPRKAKA
ncbi:MAG: DUF5615 family PIN-like protein [Planctomycetes bacterium]|nr:DUF5615 family PIN-like protein [Planctomycetota bacterium]